MKMMENCEGEDEKVNIKRGREAYVKKIRQLWLQVVIILNSSIMHVTALLYLSSSFFY